MIAGGGAQLGSNRWGDYSTMSVDPVADCTFWYTQEYYASTSSFDFKTRIAAFKMPNCNENGEPPVGDLTYYTNRGVFDGNFPNLPCEDFEEGNVAPGSASSRARLPSTRTATTAASLRAISSPASQFADDPGPDHD